MASGVGVTKFGGDVKVDYNAKGGGATAKADLAGGLKGAGTGALLAGLLGADPHRIQQTAVALLAREFDRLDAALDPRQEVEAVIAQLEEVPA